MPTTTKHNAPDNAWDTCRHSADSVQPRLPTISNTALYSHGFRGCSTESSARDTHVHCWSPYLLCHGPRAQLWCMQMPSWKSLTMLALLRLVTRTRRLKCMAQEPSGARNHDEDDFTSEMLVMHRRADIEWDNVGENDVVGVTTHGSSRLAASDAGTDFWK
ncbi:hypothetical protein CDD81_5784 [Ophiocordyceps australis]|uniref:Uncharacterized protein n=1 Tax=Ophiocordyceps australis TaxID=1399860 RepID=A0A2C5Y791_9HYPO|nr:hypothetical protein CDD81_5784 [Ophiocordyceps australis]